MVHFTQFRPAGLFYSAAAVICLRIPDYSIRTSGGLWICASLPGFSQLITSFFAFQLQGIRHRPIFRLTILLFPLFLLLSASARCFFFHSSAAYFHSDFQDKSIPFPSPVHVPLPFFCMHRLQAVRILLHVSFPFHLSKITSRKVLFQHNFPLPMENRGLEPLTFGLQSRRSSQLS